MEPPTHEKFDAFARADGRSNAAFGAEVGTSGQMVGMVRHGVRNPGRKMALAIERLTAGAIRAEDWPDVAPNSKPSEAA